jgi:formylglycine-generating enzyme required for sulfatase activity
MKIVVSYRRKDSPGTVGRVADHLVHKYGADSVFVDIDNIPPGVDFRDHIKTALQRCEIFLAMVGPHWLGKGAARINEADDPVRIEIETALQRNIAVIPVLMDGARMPRISDLPDSLKPFVYRNAAELTTGRDFHQQLDRLTRWMDHLLDNEQKPALQAGLERQQPGISTRSKSASATERETPLAPIPKNSDAFQLAEQIKRPPKPLARSAPKIATKLASKPLRLSKERNSRGKNAVQKTLSLKWPIAIIGALFLAFSSVLYLSLKQPLPTMQATAPIVAPGPAAPTIVAPAPVTPAAVPAQRVMIPKDVFKECAQCPEMIALPAGLFTMGSSAIERARYGDEAAHYVDESPQHKVAIARPFAVSKFDVTFDEWGVCVADGGCNGFMPDDEGWGRGRRPVINVSWDDAKAYVGWLSQKTGKPYRLLSEAEWEYAARAGSTTIYYWGDEVGNGNANCNGCFSQWENRQTSPVGSFKPNAFGLYDTVGNVLQWVQDCYHGDYNGAPTDGSTWTTGDCSRHVVRGGSWVGEPRVLRSAFRGWGPVDVRLSRLGFRVGRTLTP